MKLEIGQETNGAFQEEKQLVIKKLRKDSSLYIFLEKRLNTITAPQLEYELMESIEWVTDLIFDLKGLTYISHLAGDKETKLFLESYLISNPDKKNSRIDDPVSTEVPESFSCYCYQKDNRFGKNVYTIDYTIKDGDFLMEITNYTAMKYLGFTCVEEGALHMYLEVIETDEGFVLFTMAIAHDREPEVKVLFITVDLPSAFMRRITALKDWFTKRVNE